MSSSAHLRSVSVSAAEQRNRSALYRRLALETRTLTLTLRSAIDALASDPAPTIEERIALRRAWCERVQLLLQDVRVRSMRLQNLTEASAMMTAEAFLAQAEDELEALRGPAA